MIFYLRFIEFSLLSNRKEGVGFMPFTAVSHQGALMLSILLYIQYIFIVLS